MLGDFQSVCVLPFVFEYAFGHNLLPSPMDLNDIDQLLSFSILLSIVYGTHKHQIEISHDFCVFVCYNASIRFHS